MYFTEKELLEKQRRQFFSLQKFLKEKEIDIDDFCDLLPGVFHMNRINSVEMVYLDKTTRERIEIEKVKVEQNGMQIIEKLLEPDCMAHLKKVNKVADFSDDSFILSTFQNLSFYPLEEIEKQRHEYSWCFSSKKKFSDNLTISVTQPLNDLGKVYKQLEKVLDENLFLKKNLRKFDSLSPREREIMQLISCGFTSEQIAERLFISPHTVNTHRKNIWHKLEVKSYAELIHFAEHFDLL